MKGVYMAYVGSYSYTGNAKGITVYDVDVENGRFKERCEMEIDNSSYLVPAANGKTLYSIADEGVVSYRIHENGSITKLNTANIRGMRGCQLSVEPEGKYLFVSSEALPPGCTIRGWAAWRRERSALISAVPV